MIKNKDLSKIKCEPCNGNTPKLNFEEISKYLSNLNEWSVNDNQDMIFKKFKFKNFNDALNYANKIGKLSDKEVESIEEAIQNITEYVPKWLLNRQNDYDSGEDIHPVSIDLKMLHEDDVNRMKKVKSYKGIRHASGHKVRGQRTYSNGRKGLALGVSKRKGA